MAENITNFKEKNPLTLFERACVKSEPKLLEQFLSMVRHLYQYQIFQPILNLTATKISKNLLTFKLYNQRFFDLEEGNCKIIYGNSLNQFLNKVRKQNIYQITIKKLSYDIIIHEIAHMIEKETLINLKEFIDIITNDLQNFPDSIILKQTIKEIFFTALKAYPEDQKDSELFARYFQILSLSKEISGLSSTRSYKLKQVLTNFSNTYNWINSQLKFIIISLTDPQISEFSKRFSKNIEQVEHKWSKQRAKSIHGQGIKKWGKIVTSIKVDHFNN